MRLGYGGRGITVGGQGALEISEGVFVVFEALVEVGFAEEAGLLVGDVSEGVVELSYTAGGQLEVVHFRLDVGCGRTYRDFIRVVLLCTFLQSFRAVEKQVSAKRRHCGYV